MFAVQQYGGTAGLIEGNAGQFVNQCIGVLTVIVYDAVVTRIILGISRRRSACASPTMSSATVSTTPCTAKSFNNPPPAAFSPPGLRFLPRPWTPFGASVFLRAHRPKSGRYGRLRLGAH